MSAIPVRASRHKTRQMPEQQPTTESVPTVTLRASRHAERTTELQSRSYDDMDDVTTYAYERWQH
jgi:hypothetical protein